MFPNSSFLVHFPSALPFPLISQLGPILGEKEDSYLLDHLKPQLHLKIIPYMLISVLWSLSFGRTGSSPFSSGLPGAQQ